MSEQELEPGRMVVPRGAERSELESLLLLARAHPRDEAQAEADLLALCRQPSFAVAALDHDKRSGDAFLTVELAREARRCWGHLRSGIRIREQEGGYLVEGWAIDTQRGVSESIEHLHPRKVLRKKGREARASWVETDDLEALRSVVLNIGSRLERNALLRLLPRGLVQRVLATLAETIARAARGDAPPGLDRADRIRAVLLAFVSFGVRRPDLEALLGAPLETCSSQQLDRLRAALGELGAGRSWAEVSGRPAAAPSTPPQTAVEAVAQVLDEAQAEPAPPADEAAQEREAVTWTTRDAPEDAQPGDRWEPPERHPRVMSPDRIWQPQTDVAPQPGAESQQGREVLVHLRGWRTPGSILRHCNNAAPGPTAELVRKELGLRLDELSDAEVVLAARLLARSWERIAPAGGAGQS